MIVIGMEGMREERVHEKLELQVPSCGFDSEKSEVKIVKFYEPIY